LLTERLENESGYSMVEVIVAIMILSVAIIPMVGMFDAGLRASLVGSNYDKARMLANERLEKVQALPYNKTSPAGVNDSAVEIYHPGTPVSGTSGAFSYTVTTTYWKESGGSVVADTSDNTIVKPMMQVVVQVTWSGGNSYRTTGFTASGADS
jgi:prepilin-type N-terminal cleavage/methylation domain-containing protein